MSIYDEIFPSRRHSDYVQTEWAKGWGDAEAGFGYAAGFLTEHREELGSLVDQAGLAIFFMQRHRVELALKGLLEARRAAIPKVHSLRQLLTACRDAVVPVDAKAWEDLASEHSEFLEVLEQVDEGSFTFRYPVDAQGREVKRPDFINLDALEAYVERFTSEVDGLIDYLAETDRVYE